MKKIATLLLAAAMVCGVSTGAKAIDFKAHGEWIVGFDYGMNGNATGGNGKTGYRDNTRDQDEFEATQRVRLQLDAVASEALSGTVFFEIGPQVWGRNSAAGGGAGLGADQVDAIKVRRAYIDWMVPNTDLKVRMGLQGFGLPSFTTKANAVLDDDMAGVVLSYQFNENVGLTAFWARLFNDNWGGWNNYKNRDNGYRARYLDNMDAFGLVLPLTFDGVKVTPWAMYAAIGPNTFANREYNNGEPNYVGNFGGASNNHVEHGLFPVRGALHKDGTASNKRLNTYGNAIWAGLTGEVTAFDPFRIAWDVNYGSVSYGDSRLNRSGWLASLLLEYKLDWAIPGIYGWYASGDDGNPANGSERMPYIAPTGNNEFSNYSFSGGKQYWREATFSDNMVGTWGIGVRLKDMSFIEDLKHTFHINFFGGTNSTTMTRYLGNNADFYNGNLSFNDDIVLGKEQLYMTTKDYAMEFGLHNAYKMYENFTINLDANYVALWMDHSKKTWGRAAFNGKDDEVRDPWNVKLTFVYSF